MNYRDFEKSLGSNNYPSPSISGSDPSLIISIFGSYFNFIIFLILVYLALRAFRAYSVYKRAETSNSIWLKGGAIDVETLFTKIQTNIEAKNFTGITFSFATLSDKKMPSTSHKYLRVNYRKMSWYISAFPVADDYMISYWLIADYNRLLAFIYSIPVYGPVIADLVATPTLYTADVNNATDMMIEGEIKSVIDELTATTPDKRITSQDFKTMIKEVTQG